MIRILLADDHAMLRDALAALLHVQDGLRVVGHASDGREAVRAMVECKPDVAVMDIMMPELDGIEATRLGRAASPATQVVILSMYATTEHIFRALQAGAKGYVPKEAGGAEVVAAVRAVHAGQRYLSRKITDAVVVDFLHDHHPADPLGLLSHRERQILQLVGEGHSTAHIARSLSLSPKTVDTYRSRLMQKLEIDNLAGLVRFAIVNGVAA